MSWRRLGASGRSQAGWRWHAVAVHALGTRYASDWREEEDLPAPGGLGRPDGLPGERQVSAGRFSVLFFCFSFLFLLLCFDSVQRPNHFQNS